MSLVNARSGNPASAPPVHPRVLSAPQRLTHSLLFLAGCSHAPPRPPSIVHDDYEDAIAHRRWLNQREMRRNHVTGLDIALFDDN